MLGTMRVFFVLIFVAGVSYASDEKRIPLAVGGIRVTHCSYQVYLSGNRRDFSSKDPQGNRCSLSCQEAYDALLKACHRAGMGYFKDVSIAIDCHRRAHLLPEICDVGLREKNEIAKKND